MKKRPQVTLQEYIDFLGYTQEEAAQAIGVSPSRLNLVLNGKRPAGRQFCLKVRDWSRKRVDIEALLLGGPILDDDETGSEEV